MIESYKTKEAFTIGTIVYDEDTGECFEVVSCERIGVLDEFKYGITVKEIKSLQ